VYLAIAILVWILIDAAGENLPWKQSGKGLCTSMQAWTSCPDGLWDLLFPGIKKFVGKRDENGQHLRFSHYAVTDGWSLKCTFTVEQEHRRWNVNGYSSSNYRRLIDRQNPKPLRISDFTATRKAYQGATNNNTFHGKGNFDYMIQKMLLQQGPQAVRDALRHPWICIDPGNINVIGGGVICGKLVRTWAGEYQLHIKFTRFLFRNKDRYTLIEDIVGEQMAKTEDFIEDIIDLSKHHPRTMDVNEYDTHVDFFNFNYNQFTEANRSLKSLMNGQKLKVHF
jgi:hypothetical protein